MPRADINHHLFSAVVITLIRLVQFGGPVEIRPSTPWLARYSQQLLQLFDLPGGLVVSYPLWVISGNHVATTSCYTALHADLLDDVT